MLVLDTETTGLISSGLLRLDRQPEVIELCVASVIGDNVTIAFNELIKPKFLPLPQQIVDITGITDADLEGRPSFAQHAPMIKQLLESGEAVCGHNLSYDKEVLDLEFKRLGQTLEWPPLVCTVEQTVHLKGFRLKLMDLHEHLFQEKFAEAHRASNDVLALCRCVVELRKRGEM